MNYSYTVSDICKFTGLKEPFIRRCIRECRDLLSQWSIRGDNNSILFEDSALKFFDRVKQLKEEGANLVQIKSVLLKELEPQGLDEKVQDEGKLEEPKASEASFKIIMTFLIYK